MVSSTIRRLAEKVPEYGLALHGTCVKNIAAIKREGLTTSKEYLVGGGTGKAVYVCPLPRAFFTARIPEKELFERAIGSTLFAGMYAGGAVSNPKLPRGDLPAIVILKGNADYEFTDGYDENDLQDFSPFDRRKYRSFGKQPFSPGIPPEHVAAVVQLTPKEHRAIHKEHGRYAIAIKTAVNRLLTHKTLAVLQKIIEAKTKPK